MSTEKMDFTEPDIESSALLTIDVQNDFALPNAPAKVGGTYEILPKVARLLDFYRKHSLPIIHVIRIYLRDGSNADLCRRAMIAGGAVIVSPNSDGAELPDVLKPSPAHRLDAEGLLEGKVQKWSEKESVIYKARWGAFFKLRWSHIWKG